MRPRPVLHETETEIETDYYETETKNVVSRPWWSRDLNILQAYLKYTIYKNVSKATLITYHYANHVPSHK